MHRIKNLTPLWIPEFHRNSKRFGIYKFRVQNWPQWLKLSRKNIPHCQIRQIMPYSGEIPLGISRIPENSINDQKCANLFWTWHYILVLKIFTIKVHFGRFSLKVPNISGKPLTGKRQLPFLGHLEWRYGFEPKGKFSSHQKLD